MENENHIIPPPYNPDPLNLPQESEQERKRFSLGTKIVLIALITLILMIPGLIIGFLIGERERTETQTVNNICDSWSGSQLISGPIISIPFDSISPENHGGVVRLLPDALNFDADIKSQKLHRSIYEAVVYNTDIKMTGSFSMAALNKLGLPLSAYQFENASVTIGIGDLRGVESISRFLIGGESYELDGSNNIQVYTGKNNSGSGCMQSAINFGISQDQEMPFEITMKLKGSSSLAVTPVGKSNVIKMRGDCASPSFTGMFLPSERNVDKDAFEAVWYLNSTNRSYPQAFVGDRADDISASAVAVDMLIPVETYQKSERAIKYSVIVILLTFISILFAEIMLKKPINIFQYLLVGLALILFYSLLLSLSEHIAFALSYLIASLMTIGLISTYMRTVLSSAKVGYTIAALLVVIYTFIYILLCLNTFALLTGSIGLFIALAAIMFASQKLKIEKL